MSDDDRRFDTDDLSEAGSDPVEGLPAEVVPPADLKPAVVGRLRAEGVLAPPGPAVGPAARWFLTAAAVLVAFLAGRSSAGGGPLEVADPEVGAAADVAGAANDAVQPRWALFLYEEGMLDIGDLTLAEVEGEYVRWAREAAAAGTLVLGEKLAEVEFLLDSEAPPLERPLGVADPPGVLTGMFVVEAPTLEAAVEAARSTPHRAFGGTVLIRPIDPT